MRESHSPVLWEQCWWEQANPLAQAKGFVGAQPRQEIYFVIPSIFSW